MAELANKKHEKFCQQLVKHGNQARAYKEAGFGVKNAGSNAARLSANELILKRIEEIRAEQRHRIRVDLERIIDEHKSVLDFDLSDILTYEDGRWELSPIQSWPAGYSKCVSFFGFNKSGQPIIKIDKHPARESLARILGLYSDFNSSIACLWTYGLELRQGEDGKRVLTEAIE